MKLPHDIRRRSLILLPLTLMLCSGDCGGEVDPVRDKPYFYIDREDDYCQFRQYYRKEGDQNVRVITYKRRKSGDRDAWFAPGSNDIADDVRAVDGLANAQSASSTLPPLREEGAEAVVELDPRLYLLDPVSQLHVLAPGRDVPEVATVRLPRDAQGLAQARPGGPIYAIHHGTPDNDPFLPPAPPRLSVFDVETLRVTRVFDLEGEAQVSLAAQPFALSPDGSIAYVANAGFKQVDGVSVTRSTVELYDTQTGNLLTSVAMPEDPFISGNSIGINSVFVTPDGAMLWAVRNGPVVVIDARSRSVSTTFRPRGGVVDVAFSPDGTRAYVLGVSAVLNVHDTATLQQIATIPLEGAQGSRKLSLAPDGLDLFVRDDVSGLVWTINTQRLAVTDTLEENPGFTSVLAFAR